jgi:hypothetical protein
MAQSHIVDHPITATFPTDITVSNPDFIEIASQIDTDGGILFKTLD